MIRVGAGITAATGLLIFGQTEVAADVFPFSGLVTSGSAVGVLAWVAWYALKESSKQREEFKKTLDTVSERHERMEKEQLDRHERWETARHEDSEKIGESLKVMAVTCAQTRSKICQESHTDE